MSGAPLQGVFAALPTPFDEQRAIDQKAFDHLTDYLLGRELEGFALLTEAAEEPLLTSEEKRQLIKLAGARIKQKRRILVSITAPAIAEAVDLVRFAEGKGAAGFLLAPPRIPGIGYRELYRYVDKVTKSTALPVLLVSRPGNALRSLMPEEISTLVAHPGLKGVFTPHSNTSALEAWAKRFKGKEASILGGCSLTLSRTIKGGAEGVVCGLAVVASAQAAALYKAVRANEGQADEMEVRFSPAVEALGPPIVTEGKDGVQKLATKIAKRSIEGPAIPPTFPFALLKETLRLQGHPIRPDVRPPYEAVKPDASERLKLTLQQAGLI
jgi:4-hydroxy-tetrahydrodipicolinate synthase